MDRKSMADVGKYLIFGGIVLIVAGTIVWGLGRIGFRGLPGDISYEGNNFRFYFPLVSCFVLSLILTAGLWFWNWISRK